MVDKFHILCNVTISGTLINWRLVQDVQGYCIDKPPPLSVLEKKTVYKMDLNRNIFSSTTGGKWRVKTDRRRQEWSVCIGKARVSWPKPPPPLWQRFEWMEMCRWHNSSAFSRLSLVLSVSSVVTGRKSETLHRTVSLPEGCVCGCVKTL